MAALMGEPERAIMQRNFRKKRKAWVERINELDRR
jgi:hypothetical protein